jgi:uncharacterized protein
MLFDYLRTKLKDAIKGHRTIEKEILRVALGELQTIEARGDSVDDEVAAKVIKKLVKSNRETLAATEAPEGRAALEQEIAILEALLPKGLSAADLASLLAPVAADIRAAGNDGQATGVAMKHLKATGVAAGGKDVADAVKALRGAPAG